MKEKFQFYLSSIKRLLSPDGDLFRAKFQFYLSSIKSQLYTEFTTLSTSFNSTLVQLKVYRRIKMYWEKLVSILP